MKAHDLFKFLEDEHYSLMLAMTKEKHTEEEEKNIIEKFNNIDKKKLWQICNEHELDGVVGSYALSLGLNIGEDWLAEYKKQKEQLEFLKNKATEICDIMHQNGIDMIILKNGGIMIDIIEDAAKCPMEDIDSLVRKSDFLKAHEILINNGFNFKFRSEYEFEKLDEAFRDGSTEYYIDMPNGEKMWFELAWRAVAGRWIRPDMEPDTDAFMDNAHFAEGTKVKILSPEDNLLQVSIHTAKHSYVRAPGLRLHMDVDRIVSHNNIDWNSFLDKVRKTRVKTSTYLSLYIPSVILDTEIPRWVLDELRPKKEEKLLSLLSKAKLIHPKGHKFSKYEFLKFQTGLYDSFKDMLRVIYPPNGRLKEMYGYKSSIKTPYIIVMRVLDLIGIRKKKG